MFYQTKLPANKKSQEDSNLPIIDSKSIVLPLHYGSTLPTGLEPAWVWLEARCLSFRLRECGTPSRTQTYITRFRRPKLCSLSYRGIFCTYGTSCYHLLISGASQEIRTLIYQLGRLECYHYTRDAGWTCGTWTPLPPWQGGVLPLHYRLSMEDGRVELPCLDCKSSIIPLY